MRVIGGATFRLALDDGSTLKVIGEDCIRRMSTADERVRTADNR